MSRAADEELTDAWLECSLGQSISHEEHVRISFVLLRRHGRLEDARRLVEGTRANCVALDVGDRFDLDLTERWIAGVADAVETSPATDAGAFLDAHPEFRRSDLYGPPRWKRITGR
jgi:hypothetical protein